MGTAVELAIVVAVPITIIVGTCCALAWRSLTLPASEQDHVLKLIRLLGRFVRDLVRGSGHRRS
ncbi:hypothetical protein [Kribbella sp. NPDC004536]|uniref:hypothetical protein n=1 Tax=Kribbella sp. NPDC004536 TaxID=3364106 RepID=UPI003686FA6E